MKKNQANVGVIRIIGLTAALFSGFGMGGCVGGSTSSTFAGAEIVSQNSQLIGGELAEGRIGDMRMTNGKIRLIIQKPSSSINEQSIAPFGGNLIDIDGIREGLLGNDGLLELSTLVNFSTTPRYDEIKVIENGVVDGKAIVEVWGSLVRIPGRDWIGRIRRNWQQLGQAPSFLEDDHLGLEVGAIRVRTRYILRPDRQSVEIQSRFFNTGSRTINLTVTDVLATSGSDVFPVAMGADNGVNGSSGYINAVSNNTLALHNVDWVGLRGTGRSTAYFGASDDELSFKQTMACGAIDGAMLCQPGASKFGVANLSIEADESVDFVRHVATSSNGFGDLFDELAAVRREESIGHIVGTVINSGSSVVDDSPTVAVLREFNGRWIPVAQSTVQDGEFNIAVPAGVYQVSLAGKSIRRYDPIQITTTVAAQKETKVKFEPRPMSQVKMFVQDESGPIAADIYVYGVGPDFAVDAETGDASLIARSTDVVAPWSPLEGLGPLKSSLALQHWAGTTHTVESLYLVTQSNFSGRTTLTLPAGTWILALRKGATHNLTVVEIETAEDGRYELPVFVPAVVDLDGYFDLSYGIKTWFNASGGIAPTMIAQRLAAGDRGFWISSDDNRHTTIRDELAGLATDIDSDGSPDVKIDSQVRTIPGRTVAIDNLGSWLAWPVEVAAGPARVIQDLNADGVANLQNAKSGDWAQGASRLWSDDLVLKTPSTLMQQIADQSSDRAIALRAPIATDPVGYMPAVGWTYNGTGEYLASNPEEQTAFSATATTVQKVDAGYLAGDDLFTFEHSMLEIISSDNWGARDDILMHWLAHLNFGRKVIGMAADTTLEQPVSIVNRVSIDDIETANATEVLAAVRSGKGYVAHAMALSVTGSLTLYDAQSTAVSVQDIWPRTEEWVALREQSGSIGLSRNDISDGYSAVLTLEVAMQTPTWTQPDRIELISNVPYSATTDASVHLERYSQITTVVGDLVEGDIAIGSLVQHGQAKRYAATVSFTVALSDATDLIDRYWVVRAIGSATPAMTDSDLALPSFAISNPLYLDVDGNGYEGWCGQVTCVTSQP